MFRFFKRKRVANAELGARCDELNNELIAIDPKVLAEIKDKLETLEHTVESIVMDLDIREEEVVRMPW